MNAPLAVDHRAVDRASLRRAILEKLIYAVGKDPGHATIHDWFQATALAVRDRMVDGWMDTTRSVYRRNEKRVYYLSLEFLIGRLLGDSMRNLGIEDAVTGALADLGVDARSVLRVEPDAALGNGGLGRLAACFMESMATVGIAGFGFGIRYDHGLFKQVFADGWQVERPEDWLVYGNPWEFERPEVAYPVRFYGHVREETGPRGRVRRIWDDGQQVLAIAYDTAIVGWRGASINTLRLWKAESVGLIDLEQFNRGDYMRAVQDQVLSQSISRVLYPNDSTEAGQELRLKQEYFFTSASLQDILRRHIAAGHHIEELPERVAIQLNDTHPSIAVPELVRLLVDEHDLELAAAFDLTRRTIGYTNHTLMPEALERWPVALIERMLPRHMQLIYEINAHVLDELRARPGNSDPFLADVSIIEEAQPRFVRMGHLAFLGAHKVNGVSALHTDLMKQTVFRVLHQHYPDRITNKTNGITPRRWLLGCNPPLAALVSETIGDSWIGDLDRLGELRPHAEDSGFRERFAKARRIAKEQLGQQIAQQLGLVVDPNALFDAQIKRIHEYKRQLLNILETIALWDAIRRDPTADWQPRVKIFAGKAAASYERAKLIIKLINDVAAVVNRDPLMRGRLAVAYLPNYNVTLAESIVPAADLSEQISTAGMEASGTGNMKFALNGAITIGTLDGANVEIRDHVGPENIVIFGLKTDEVHRLRQGGHRPARWIEECPPLARTLELIATGTFSPDDPRRFRPLIDDLRHSDWFLVTADFAAYWAAQRQIDKDFADPVGWWRKAVLNTAGMGYFSSDRTIHEYAAEIWGVTPNA